MNDETKRLLLETADKLAMWASQIREYCDDNNNWLPSAWRMESTISEYAHLTRKMENSHEL